MGHFTGQVVRRTFTINAGEWKTVDGTHAFHDDYRVVEVEVDFDGLAAALGARAASNRTRKSVEVGGLVVVRDITARKKGAA